VPDAALRRQADGGEHLLFVAVHTPGGQQAEDMHGATGLHRAVYRTGVGGVIVKTAVGNGLVDTGDILEDHPSGAQAHVAHL
jgi:hypothetical protein